MPAAAPDLNSLWGALSADQQRQLTRRSIAYPVLEYHYAFDFCAIQAAAAGEALVIASGAYVAREMLKRLPGRKLTLVAAGGWLGEDLTGALGVEIDRAHLVLAADLNAVTGTFSKVMVALPDEKLSFAALAPKVAAGGQIILMLPGTLARFLPPVGENKSAAPPLTWRAALPQIQALGWQVGAHYGFHAPNNIVWSYLFRALTLARQEHLADRALYQGRKVYVVKGWLRALATLNLVVAQPAVS